MRSIDQDYLIWHPFSQMKNTNELPLVTEAKGAYLHTSDGRKIFDAISSWWVNLHGHSNPYLAEAIAKQACQLEHVIFAGFTHQPSITLCERLDKHLPEGEWKYFFSDNGSTAVEVALKMAYQFFRVSDKQRKVNLIAFEGSYHGDTFGAMSAAERSVFTEPWDDLFFEASHLPVPTDENIDELERRVESLANDPCIFIYEPLVLGAAGMQFYKADHLERLQTIIRKRQGILIADEVMTGFGRTGKWFASEHTNVKPDMLCLSKGLTGGALPMSLTVCDQRFYNTFLDDKFEKGFLHGHSFTGNPLGCAAALASLDLMEQQETWDGIDRIHACYEEREEELKVTGKLQNIRMIGPILAMDVMEENKGYIHPLRDRLYNAFMKRGQLIRPLGNVIYLLPPYIATAEEIHHSIDVIIEVVQEL
ncbi:adenosylmethionine--8-amino-7-oxononanoate transaminase [Sanyastnella coralliicola]|uniref:adenosylmethionine--8-amino-7-oxononanoate transaminase n=1 Tax=Sanyastnella coralliicola TaxID=3069118 RepID=UPI0027BADA67|nr:adenosylmethionine--8-amino-7-oxononanoate transaminase [Longitalea sp. SCSIO 12813]